MVACRELHPKAGKPLCTEARFIGDAPHTAHELELARLPAVERQLGGMPSPFHGRRAEFAVFSFSASSEALENLPVSLSVMFITLITA
jgi:hypothetical protein